MKKFENNFHFLDGFEDADIILLCETWAWKDLVVPSHLAQRGFTSIQVHAVKPAFRGRPGGGLVCFYNMNIFELDNIFKSKVYLIFRIIKLNIVIVFI